MPEAPSLPGHFPSADTSPDIEIGLQPPIL